MPELLGDECGVETRHWRALSHRYDGSCMAVDVVSPLLSGLGSVGGAKSEVDPALQRCRDLDADPSSTDRDGLCWLDQGKPAVYSHFARLTVKLRMRFFLANGMFKNMELL